MWTFDRWTILPRMPESLTLERLREQVQTSLAAAEMASEPPWEQLREQVLLATAPAPPLREDLYLIVRYTRHWLHYGFLVFILLSVLVGAVKGLLGG